MRYIPPPSISYNSYIRGPSAFTLSSSSLPAVRSYSAPPEVGLRGIRYHRGPTSTASLTPAMRKFILLLILLLILRPCFPPIHSVSHSVSVSNPLFLKIHSPSPTHSHSTFQFLQSYNSLILSSCPGVPQSYNPLILSSCPHGHQSYNPLILSSCLHGHQSYNLLILSSCPHSHQGRAPIMLFPCTVAVTDIYL